VAVNFLHASWVQYPWRLSSKITTDMFIIRGGLLSITATDIGYPWRL